MSSSIKVKSMKMAAASLLVLLLLVAAAVSGMVSLIALIAKTVNGCSLSAN